VSVFLLRCRIHFWFHKIESASPHCHHFESGEEFNELRDAFQILCGFPSPVLQDSLPSVSSSLREVRLKQELCSFRFSVFLQKMVSSEIFFQRIRNCSESLSGWSGIVIASTVPLFTQQNPRLSVSVSRCLGHSNRWHFSWNHSYFYRLIFPALWF